MTVTMVVNLLRTERRRRRKRRRINCGRFVNQLFVMLFKIGLFEDVFNNDDNADGDVDG